MSWQDVLGKLPEIGTAIAAFLAGWLAKKLSGVTKQLEEAKQDAKEISDYNARKDVRGQALKERIDNLTSRPVSASSLAGMLSSYAPEDAKAPTSDPGKG